MEWRIVILQPEVDGSAFTKLSETLENLVGKHRNIHDLL